MAATANHPDGNFADAVEPDEDIAAIAKQISDHAEVIYQTWKAKGLAPNEILTCHNNLNVANKFGSVLTPKFAPVSSKDSNSDTSMTDVLYSANGTPANTASLEHIIPKFVVEDKARLASRQKNADTPCTLSTAKSYPSSIQYFLQKFEEKNSPNTVEVSSYPSSNQYLSQKFGKNSPNTVEVLRKNNGALSKAKPRFTPVTTSKPTDQYQLKKYFQPTKAKNVNPDSDVDGLSTWPIKNRTRGNESLTPCKTAVTENGVNYPATKSSTLPLKKEKNGVFCQNFIDEVAKEEEKLIHALKTGAIISAVADSEASNRSSSYNAKLPSYKSSEPSSASSEEETDSSTGENIKHSIISAALQNLSKKSDASNFSYAVDPSRRKKRIKCGETSSENAIVEKLRSISSNQNSNKQTANPVRPFLTRGSVAERVMMFEKCPTEILEKRAKTINPNAGSWKHLASDVHRKIQVRFRLSGDNVL